MGGWLPSQGGHPHLVAHPHTLLPSHASLSTSISPPQKEIDWVDSYHRRVWEALSPRLAGQEEELAWLREATSPL